MKLKIAYISDERFPSFHTDTQQVIKNIDALGRLGMEVDLIQPRLWSHLRKNVSTRKKEICHYYNVEGCFNLKDILLWPASDLRIEKFTHGLAAPFKTKLGNYDLVYTRNIIPLLVASRLGFPVLFETYRALPHTDPWVWRLVKMAFRHKQFIGISTHSEYSKQVMIDAGAPPSLVEAIPNGFDPNDFQNLPSKEDARKKLGLTIDKAIVVYTGQIREDKGVHSLLDLAHECPEVTMLIVGGTIGSVEELRSVVNQQKLTNVQLVPQVPIYQVPDYLAAADILILPPSAAPMQKATVLPIKTFTYLAAGRPIIAPDVADTKGVLIKDVNCIKVQPDVPTAAAAAVRQLLRTPNEAERISVQAKLDAKKYTWDGRAKNLVQFLERRIG